ncbi:hypothetical protein JCM31598_27810 [Desulfonatronum parangueonense]
MRVFNLCRFLAERHVLLTAFFPENDTEMKHCQPMDTKVFKKCIPLPDITGKASWKRFLHPLEGHLVKRYNPDSHDHVRETLAAVIHEGKVDALFIASTKMAQFIPEMHLDRIPVVLDICDSRTLTLEREYAHLSSIGPGEWIRNRLYLARARYDERNVTEKFDAVTTVSPVDLTRLKDLNRQHGKLHLVPNGVELPSIPPQREMERAVIFWGALDFPPNTTAMRFFLNEVWPLLRMKNVRWHVAGKNPPQWLQDATRRNGDGLELHGFVEDLQGLASRIPVMVNPMRIGSGLKNKVLEAFSMERAVISTDLGMEAVQAEAGVHYVRANTGVEFAHNILRLLEDPQRCRELGHAAREMVAHQYTWKSAAQKLEPLFGARN